MTEDEERRIAASERALEKMMENFGEVYPGANQDAMDVKRRLKARRAREEGKR